MVIESKARKYITDAIDYELQLTELERLEEAEEKIMSDYQDKVHEIKAKLSKQIAKINSVANMEGHGRDDLDYSILNSAENIFKKISVCESESIRILAQNVRSSFSSIRKLLRKYSENIEIIDP